MVIGGGVSESAPLFLDEAREHYAARLTGRGNRPLARVRVAQLGEAAAVVGAAELAREHALARSSCSGSARAQSCAPSSSSSRSSGGAGHSRSTSQPSPAASASRPSGSP